MAKKTTKEAQFAPNRPLVPMDHKWLYIYSVKMVDKNGQRRAQVKASELYPNIEDGMSVFFYCETWIAPSVGQYVICDIQYCKPVDPDATPIH